MNEAKIFDSYLVCYKLLPLTRYGIILLTLDLCEFDDARLEKLMKGVSDRMARSSVKIGIIMLLAWVIPLFGILLAAIGLYAGISGYSANGREMARAGIFLNSLGLTLALLNISIGLYLFVSGAINPDIFFNQLN